MVKIKNSWFSIIIIASCVLVGIIIFQFILGSESNFQDPLTKHKAKNFLGMMYMGGVIVPFLISFLLMAVVFIVERLLTITAAFGKGDLTQFVNKINQTLKNDDIDGAIQACKDQQGSIGNVVLETLKRYTFLKGHSNLSIIDKTELLHKEVEHATMLELPVLQKNLNVLATLASVATLVGLLGTVVGMIRAFGALATAGSPDSQALATGISEALFNTALGIATSALANIAYNYFSTKIDELTDKIEEVSFSIENILIEKSSK